MGRRYLIAINFEFIGIVFSKKSLKRSEFYYAILKFLAKAMRMIQKVQGLLLFGESLRLSRKQHQKNLYLPARNTK